LHLLIHRFSVLKIKNKKNKIDPAAVWHGATNLPPCRSAAGSWRRTAPPWRKNQTPAAVPHGGRDLTPWLRRQEPAAVGHDARCTFVENFDSTIYFSKITTK
jgi:hypothetical protein